MDDDTDLREKKSYSTKVDIEKLCCDLQRLLKENEPACYEYWHAILLQESCEPSIINHLGYKESDIEKNRQGTQKSVSFSPDTLYVIRKLNISPILPSLYKDQEGFDIVISRFKYFAANAALI